MSIQDTLKKAWETGAPILFRLKNSQAEAQTSYVSDFKDGQVVVRVRKAADLQVVTLDEFEIVELLPKDGSTNAGFKPR